MRRFPIILALVAMAGCSLLWPPEIHGADIWYRFAFPDTTIRGEPIGTDYVDHFLVFWKVDGELVQSSAVSDSTEVSGQDLFGIYGLLNIDPLRTYELAVAAVDTFAQTGALSVFSLPHRPADANPGPAGPPGSPAVISSNVW